MAPAPADTTAVTEKAPTAAAVPLCARCGAHIVRRRRTAQQDETLCLSCDQRARRSAYFRLYYETHRERILDKNRRWAKDNRDKLVQLRQARLARQPRGDEQPKLCVDCGSPVVRAARCRRCYIRNRYATDPEYRTRRLATTRRWLDRRQEQLQSAASARPARRATRRQKAELNGHAASETVVLSRSAQRTMALLQARSAR